jgi:hypothetical protein
MMIRRCLPLGLLTLLLSGCSLLPATPALPTPVRPPEVDSVAEALQLAVEDEFPLYALTIGYEVGNPAWDGRTVLTARGSGPLDVTFAQGEQQQAWQSSLGEDEFLALVRLLVDHEIWLVRSQRETGVPDEARPTVTVEVEGFAPLVVSLWAGEAQENADFRAVVEVLAGLAREVSGGAAR